MAEHFYQAVVKRWCEPSLGSPCSMPTHSTHNFRFSEPITHERMGDIATRLVAGERLLTRNTQRFGRVVWLQVDEEHGFGFNTPTGVCLPASERMVASPQQLRGLRSEAMAHDCCSVTVKRDRQTGGAWSKSFMGALSLSECVPTRIRDKRHPDWAFDLDGPTGAWCGQWMLWVLRQIPEHTTDVDISDEGVLSRAQPDEGEMFVAYATDNAKLRAWSTRAPACIKALWAQERANDSNISAMLRAYRSAMLAFDHTWWDGHWPNWLPIAQVMFEASKAWGLYGSYLGYDVPTASKTAWQSPWRGFSASYLQANKLTLKRHGDVVFELVNFLYQVWDWLPRVTSIQEGKDNGQIYGYFFPASSYVKTDSFSHPNGNWKDYGQAYGRANAMWVYRWWDAFINVMWAVVHALNLLEALIIPGNRRALERTSPAAPTVRPSKVGAIPRRVPSVWEWEPYISIGTAPRDPILTKFFPERPKDTAIAVAPIKPRRQFKWDFSTDAERRGTTDYDATTPEPKSYGGQPGQGPKENLWRKFDAVIDAWTPEAKRKEWDANSSAAQELARAADGYDTPNIRRP